jgi:hypothetical protein
MPIAEGVGAGAVTLNSPPHSGMDCRLPPPRAARNGVRRGHAKLVDPFAVNAQPGEPLEDGLACRG